ncbi:MFS general substrate transporter [Aspergillus affinis]|uniref:MFS general substrate transporter n=1 Tax=Aspergillus affinis TaxID=1070780 RepID=UPI0022FF13E2|nr:MFS general substrate transporter [Aspergillus affinis]KAI9039540.1 MFS general substrate transporter [Aspergillus affinis]
MARESPNNPRNWAQWKKNAHILMVPFHSMIATLMAAGIIPAYDMMAEEYNVTVPEASYLTSIQILLLGLCPFIWKPITSIYGRYHVFLFSVLESMVCNIGGARCTTYEAQMATRILTSILISPPIGIGSGVITELCEPEKRAQKLGWWMLMITLGTPSGPFIIGFVTKHIGIEWIFWIFAIINLVQFIAHMALGAETMYLPEFDNFLRAGEAKKGVFDKLIPRRLDSRSLKTREFIEPIFLCRHYAVLIPAVAHSIIFCYGNIMLIVEMPIAFGEKFDFDAQQIGLQFIAIIIGCLLGEQLSGPLSDFFLRSLSKRKGYTRPLDKAQSWDVTPCIGAAIASFGNQVITTILISFAVDSYKEKSTNVGVCINLFRHIYGFIGTFYFPSMFESLQFAGAAGVMCAIIGACALVPIIAVQFAASRSTHQV